MDSTGTRTAVWWIRRDLRLADNAALTRALSNAQTVLPVFILDPALLNSEYVGPKRLEFLFASLRELDSALQSRGSRLITRRGHPLEILQKLVAESGVEAIFAERDYSAYALKRDRRIAGTLPLNLVGTPSIRSPQVVMKRDGAPYTIFTPFSKAWMSVPLPRPSDLYPVPEHIPTPGGIPSEDVPFESDPNIACIPGW
ncbi:MAG: deoxyribodipyrimidine photo-lyase [Chloroflexota bacterium]